MSAKDYGEICQSFPFYYPNGIPKDAKRCCFECANLDENYLTQTIHETQNYRCLIREREIKKNAWKEGRVKGQQTLGAVNF